MLAVGFLDYILEDDADELSLLEGESLLRCNVLQKALRDSIFKLHLLKLQVR